MRKFLFEFPSYTQMLQTEVYENDQQDATV
jgi:hypothetical protein